MVLKANKFDANINIELHSPENHHGVVALKQGHLLKSLIAI